MAGDAMSQETEKQLSWIQRIADNLYRWIANALRGLWRMIGNGLRNSSKDLFKEIGERDGDRSQQANFTLDDLKEFDKILENGNIERSYNFKDKEGNAISPGHKLFRKINSDFRKTTSTKTHVQIEIERLKFLNSKIEWYRRNLRYNIKENNLTPEVTEKILNISAVDIREYDNGSRDKINDTLMNTINKIGYRQLALNEETIKMLEHDINVSQGITNLKEAISFENSDTKQSFFEKRDVILERYHALNEELSELTVQRKTADEFLIKEIDNRISYINNDPIFKAIEDETLRLGGKLETANDYSNEITRTVLDEITGESVDYADLSKDSLRELLVKEYNYIADNEYQSEDFKTHEIERDEKYHSSWSEFCEEYDLFSKDRLNDNSEVLRENEEVTYKLDGTISKAKGQLYDKYTNLDSIVLSVNYGNKQEIGFGACTAKYNNKMLRKKAEKELDDKEETPKDYIKSDAYLDKEYDTIDLQEVFGNVSSYSEFSDKINENELIVQAEMSVLDAKNLVKTSQNINEDSPIIARCDAMYNTKENGEGIERGSDSDDYNLVSVTMTFEQYKSCMSKLRQKDEDGKIAYVIEPQRIRMFNDGKYVDEKSANSEYIPNELKCDRDNIIKGHSKEDDMIGLSLACGDTFKNASKTGKIYSLIERTSHEIEGGDSSGLPSSNLRVEMMSDKGILNNSHIVDILSEYIIDEKRKTSPSNTKSALENARINKMLDVEIIKDVTIEKSESGIVIPEIDKKMDCMIYDRNKKVLVKDKDNSPVSLRVDKNKEIDFPYKGSFILVPYEELTDDENINKEILDINPRLGLLEKNIDSIQNEESFISNGYAFKIDDVQSNDIIELDIERNNDINLDKEDGPSIDITE